MAVLDAELAGLPDAVRAALVSCYYEGLTQDEAARRLGWKVRTVRARVARGRKLLRTRLARRGVDLGAALAAAAVALDAPAVVPPVSPAPTAGTTVSELIGHGLAITGRSVRLPVAVATAVVAVAGAGYVVATNTGLAGGGNGSPAVASLPTATPAAVSEPPARSKLDFEPAAVYDRAVDGCVYIVRETDAGPVEGTGTLINREQRLVLTTYRVVGDSDVVSVQFPYHNPDETIDTNRTEYARSAAGRLTPMGRVVRRDKARDLALIKLDRLGRHARPLELAEPGIPKAVLHIGSGSGELFPMTVRRVLSADAPAITLSGPTDDFGGPLVDRDGKLAGVVVGEAAGPAAQKVTRAIGVAEVRAFLAEKDKPIPPPVVPASAEPPRTPIPADYSPIFDPIPQDSSPEGVKLHKEVVDSAVFIVVVKAGGILMGSGSLIDKEKRYVLTNYHLVGDQDKVYVQFPHHLKDGSIMTDKRAYIERIPAGQTSTGKVLYRDKTRDLAIVQLDKLSPTAKPIKLAKSSVVVGDNTWNLGNPGVANRLFGMTKGMVRAVRNEDLVVGGEEFFRIKARMVTVTNPIERADSGGPLVDKRGYLVGVTEGGPIAVGPVSSCIGIAEVRAFLKEKKIVLDEDGPEESPKTKPKHGLDSDRPKIDPPPKKENGTENPPKPDRPSGRGPSPEDEKVATVLLQRAKVFKDDDDKAYYAKKLQDVVTKHPGTAAAKEAQKLLDGLKK